VNCVEVEGRRLRIALEAGNLPAAEHGGLRVVAPAVMRATTATEADRLITHGGLSLAGVNFGLSSASAASRQAELVAAVDMLFSAGGSVKDFDGERLAQVV
jgi:hypothetical protein